jgi:hypothetical protein
MWKRILECLFHLAIATLVVPMLTMISAGLVYPLASLISAANMHQFYSDHILALTTITGLWLAYILSDPFASRCAPWIWIPSALGFIARILTWRAEGSVLFHSGIIEHFFTAHCQIQNYRELDFASHCSDKLFLTPLVLGSLGYSVGAAIHRAAQHRLSGAANSTGRAPTQLVHITTRFGAFIAVVITASLLAGSLRQEMTGRFHPWQWLFSGLLPTWSVVIINIAFWGVICRLGLHLALASLRKDEKAFLVAIVWNVMLNPVSALFPRIIGGVHAVQTLLCLVSFLAGLAILLSFWRPREQAT